MECWMNGKMAIINSNFHNGRKETVLTVHTLKEGLLWGSETSATPVTTLRPQQTILTNRYLYGCGSVQLVFGDNLPEISGHGFNFLSLWRL